MRLLICGLAATAMLAASPADAGRNKCKSKCKKQRHNDCCVSAPAYSSCGSTYSTSVVYDSAPVYSAPASDCGCGSTVSAPVMSAPVISEPVYSAPASDCGCASTVSAPAPVTYAAATSSDCGCGSTGISTVSYDSAPVSYESAPMSYSTAPVSYESAPVSSDCGCSATSGTMSTGTVIEGGTIMGGSSDSSFSPQLAPGETLVPGSVQTIDGGSENYNPTPANNDVEDAPAPPKEEKKADNGDEKPKA